VVQERLFLGVESIVRAFGSALARLLAQVEQFPESSLKDHDASGLDDFLEKP
jgi:hypothetical protein